ncbi:MAG: stage V sporulation protein D [Firmicutes bacterium HGW-Firmicutes-15]|nr:MAG: stage V sporulation protein D [Firmicutes bacterium HGW-Firmicutes-15]
MQTTGLLVRKRIATLFFLFTIGFCLLGVRIFWVQFVQGAELSAKATQNRMRDVPVESKRGIIYDRNGHELAISISADSVYAIPAEIRRSKREQEVAQKLAQVLGMDQGSLFKRVTATSSFEWIKRQITPEQAKQIRDMKLPGIDLTEESRRFYPKGTLASHILGVSGIDNTGLEGIDNFYNNLVGGTKGRIIVEHDAAGRDIPEATHKYIPPVDGGNLVLTIDETIQYITERELDKIFKERQAKNAAAIVMDPKTGEILAMASRPTFNPNSYGDSPAINRRNFAINDAYEPGSTMKITTSAMALEEGIVNRNTQFYCPGYIKVGVETIGCPDRKAHGDQTFAQIVENSCNVSFVKVGLELGLEKYYQYLNAFGFGQLTGIDLPGEAKGILVPKASAKQIDLAVMAMGQANAVTPIQLISAVSAVSNNGKLMKPHLLKQVLDRDGKVIKTNEPVMVRQVIAENTAKELCVILEGEVTNGTGWKAYIEGYHVGGKTGTAQKIAPGGGYLANEYVSSFIGLAPSDDPRLVCLVVVDAPKGYPYYGGWVAAPAAREIINDSLRYLEVPLRQKEGQQVQVPEEKVVVPDVVNLPLADALASISGRGLNAKVNGTGNIVWQQTPKGQTKLSKGSQVIIYLSPFKKDNKDGEITVPDLQGKSMKEVARILADLGLHLLPEGYGISYKQSPEAGKVITSGSTVKVQFQPLGE